MERFHLAQKSNDEAFGNKCQAAGYAEAGNQEQEPAFSTWKAV